MTSLLYYVRLDWGVGRKRCNDDETGRTEKRDLNAPIVRKLLQCVFLSRLGECKAHWNSFRAIATCVAVETERPALF